MTDLFQAPTTATEYNPDKDYFSELVGEGKKFKTPEDLAKGKAQSDAFIEQLKQEQAGLRADLENAITELKSRKSVEELMDRIQSSTTGTSTNSNGNTNTSDGDNNPPAFDPSKLDEIVEARLNKRETERAHQNNLLQVKTALQNQYGENYVTKLTETAEDLGLTKEALNAMAATQPKAFLKLMGVGNEQKAPAPRQGDLFAPPVSSQNFVPTANNEKNFSHYEQLRKSDPTKYWSPQVQNEMFQAASRLGDRFYT